jgi:hypothetical protein
MGIRIRLPSPIARGLDADPGIATAPSEHTSAAHAETAAHSVIGLPVEYRDLRTADGLPRLTAAAALAFTTCQSLGW